MRTSTKQRLTDALVKEERDDGQNHSWALRALRARGSGPLPRWLRELARERGLA